VVLVLRILKRFGLGYTHSVKSVLNIVEDRALGLVVVSLQTDTVCITQNNQVIDLLQRHKLVLESVISQS
jgi:hypothetical protein